MKKTMLVLCFASMALTVMAADSINTEKTAEVKVTAEVVKPLSIQAEPVDFGRVISGTEVDKPVTEGKISITCDTKQKVLVQFSDGKVENWKNNISDVQVKLMAEDGNSNEELTYMPAVDPEPTEEIFHTGTVEMKLLGKLTVPAEAESGKYTGTLKVKVKYE